MTKYFIFPYIELNNNLCYNNKRCDIYRVFGVLAQGESA